MVHKYLKKTLKLIFRYSSLLFFALAIYIVWGQVKKLGLKNILESIFSIPLSSIIWAAIVVIIGYLALSLYDFLALKYIKKNMTPLRVMAASMSGFAVSNNVGHAYISGAAVRYDFYSSWGLTGGDILKMIGFSTLTYVLGVGFLLDISLLVAPATDIPGEVLSPKLLYGGGAIMTIAFLIYWFAVIVPKRTLRIKKVVLPAPSKTMTITQIALGAVDMLLVAIVCYIVMQHSIKLNFVHFLSIFMIAQFIGLSTQVPGGIGVFEGIFLYLLPPEMEDTGGVMASLIVFRIMYYFIPLAVAGLSILAYQSRPIREMIFGADNPVKDKNGEEVL